jgi:predicted MFS family arabinose efflux permease
LSASEARTSSARRDIPPQLPIPNTTATPAPVPAGKNHAFRALRNPSYRLYFVAQVVGFAGAWMQTVAQGWLVYRLTGSSLLLGLVAFLNQIPALVISPFAGVMIDRLPLRKLIAWTQGLLAVQSTLLAVLVGTGAVTYQWLLGLALFAGLVNSLDMPARQTYLVELAGPDDLPSAIALSSSAFNTARVVGTSLGGVVVATLGETACFAINAVTFGVTIATVLLVTPPHVREPRPPVPPLRALREGFAYARSAPHTRTILPLIALISLFSSPYLPMLPVFAKDVLQGGPELLGGLNAAVGIGSIVGALGVAAVVNRKLLFPRVGLGMATMGAALVIVGVSRLTWLTLLVLPVSGFGFVTFLSSSNTLLQTEGDPAFHGRVMALYTMVSIGLFPVGTLLFGALGDAVGVGPTVAAGGLATVALAAWLQRRFPVFRRPPAGAGAGAGT